MDQQPAILTCAAIAARAQQLSPVIGKHNYHDVARQIHPSVDAPTTIVADADLFKRYRTAEWKEYQQASRFHSGESWLDMVVFLVAMWQWRKLAGGQVR